ncbi:MAG: ATP-binding protein, partial [Candidatus Zixiibacteriota bacterium]
DGFKVDIALTSFEALSIVESKKIDIVISDIRMPNMNGIEMIKIIQGKHPDIAVIFITGYANLNTAKEAITHGASDYILKPFELSEIRQAVNKAVEKINKASRVKKTGFQLDHLSDLHQILFTAGDKKSLISTSLKFAIMHCKSDYGSILHWNEDKSSFFLVTVDKTQTTEIELPQGLLFKSLDSTYLWEFQEPLIITKFEEHPLYKANPNPQLKKYILPFWENESDSIIIMPISRTYSIYGLLMISASGKKPLADDPNLKFLTITAHQLAMSLENLGLLEESRKAFEQLKNLQDETIQLEKMAARGEMSAEIGHELNNFLGVVAGNLSLLDMHIKKKSYEKLGKYITAMFDNINKIKNFTSNLMDLQPISSTKEVLSFEKLLMEVIEYLKPQKRFQEVIIKLTPITETLPFNADTVHIQQLLYNLFNNAADATAGFDNKEIMVSATINNDNESFRVSIEDTGSGIEPELIKKAFKEKFTTKKQGHGFGLLVCKRIIENHDGKLNIESTPGKGTSIIIDFPLAIQNKADAIPS